MDLKKIDYILELAKTCNFNRAAESLFIHKNTLVYRYNKYKELLNVNPVASGFDRTFLEAFYSCLRRKKQ